MLHRDPQHPSPPNPPVTTLFLAPSCEGCSFGALFCKSEELNSSVFRPLHTLCVFTRGVTQSEFNFSTFDIELVPNSFRIRTYRRTPRFNRFCRHDPIRNSFRFRTYRHPLRNPFRIRTYRKSGGGGGLNVIPFWDSSRHSPLVYPELRRVTRHFSAETHLGPTSPARDTKTSRRCL